LEARLAQRASGSVNEFAYVTNAASNNVSAYAITATTGALTPVPGSPFRTATEPWGIATDPSGSFAYVTLLGYGKVGA
jgi:DNA-binding beta-propeller fold protein YncE